ncbi:MAG TPA: isoleucine--tRNA ligase [Candidatus Bathyarchaeia archaeon]|nr:isoleucine--tRNA ligase [Candidatus Bathyarchaeia archaeon]
MTPGIVGKLTREYDPHRTEQETLNWWSTNRTYQKTKKKLAKRPKFYFLDGPPYVTNAPHVGLAWNKTLKDIVIRYHRMRGYNVHDQPGYDCHGLPVEVLIEKSLKLTSKKDIENVVGVDRFIAVCKKFAEENVQAQTGVLKDLGIWMDWDNPYLTYRDDYIESVWWTIKRAQEKRLLYKALKVVHWCPRCETALAGYEVTDEYRSVQDYSIYVKLPLVDKPGAFILIWTTTPWTLPANLGVMVHPDKTYVLVDVEGDKLILAKERLEQVLGVRGYKILEEYLGRELEGVQYRPPLQEETQVQIGADRHQILLSGEHVSMSDGTGAVHTAPGHGEEDFEVGTKYGLPAFSPVDPSGRFTKEAGKYAGLSVRDANRVIIEDLRAKNLLWKEETIEHSYPHCWRCKTALILRATDQWFVKVTSIKKKMLAENEKVRWVPEWAGSKRFHDWLEGARDWVISRQRYWGVPLPVWTCEQCGEHTVVGSKAELVKLALHAPKQFELHRNGVDKIQVKCKSCGGNAKREPDILDVWMDSGTASWASLGYPRNSIELKRWWPADLILEAHDQTRGWFYNQLVPSIVAFNRSPYRTVLMHGHTLDQEGEKMSKSKGNFVSPGDVVAKYGRDALRFYTVQSTLWEDFQFSWNAVEVAAKDLQIAWNVLSFATLYMHLDKFKPDLWSVRRAWTNLRPEDKWLVSRSESLLKDVTGNMQGLELHLALRKLRAFAIDDLSHWYIRLVRRRFWQEKQNKDKLASYAALHYALKTWLILSSPFIPLFTEKVYQQAFRRTAKSDLESIHMSSWPNSSPRWINKRLEGNMEIVQQVSAASSSARQSKKLKLRQPVAKILIVTNSAKVTRAVKSLRPLFLQQTNSKDIQLVGHAEEEQLKRLIAEPNFKGLGPVFKGDANKVAEALRSADGRQLFQAFQNNKSYPLKVDDRDYTITDQMVSFKEEMPENFAMGSFEDGRVYIDLTIPKELMREGLVREIVRRLQEMRKRLDLPVDAFVEAYVTIPDAQKLEWMEDERDYLMEEVRADALHLLRPDQEKPKANAEENWDIEGQTFQMGLLLKKTNVSNA